MRIQDKTHSPIELNSLDKPLIEHHPGYVTSVDVSLPQHLFLRLQKLAIPLVDTPASGRKSRRDEGRQHGLHQ